MTQLTGLRGTATLSYRDAEQRGSVTQAVAVETPDRFRLEIFSLLGVAAVHVCDGQRLAAYFPREHVVYRGVASPANLGRFTRLHVSAGQVARLLLGLPPFPFATSAAEVRRDPPDGYRLDLPRADGGRAMLRFDTHTRQLGGWTIADPSGHIRVAGELRDYRAVAGRWFPFTMRLSDPVAGREISLEYREVSLDPTPSAALFTLDVPDGVQEIDLDAEEILTP